MHSGRGFNYDWKGGDRWVIEPPSNAGFPYYSLLDVREDVTELAHNRLHRKLAIALGGWHRVQLTRSDGPAQAATRLISDFERLLMWDRSQGGNAIDTHLTGSEVQVNPAIQPSVFVEVTAMIQYRTNIEEPTEAL